MLGRNKKATALVKPIPAQVESSIDLTPPQDQTLGLITQPKTVKIGELLLQQGILTQQQLAEAIVQQTASGKRMGELLVNLGLVDEESIIAALAQQLQMPLADLGTATPDPEVAKLLGESLARSLNAIPLRREPDGTVAVAISDPTTRSKKELEQALKSPVSLELGTDQQIKWAIDNTYRALQDVDSQIGAFIALHGSRGASWRAGDINAEVESGPVIEIVNMILAQAMRDRTSDIHIEPQDNRVRVRFRIDGALHDVIWLPASIGNAIISRIKVMGDLNIVERRRPQDGQLTTQVDGHDVDVRISTTAVVRGEKVVLRILDKSKPLLTLQNLGMTKETHETLSTLLRSPYGMLLCAGPTGSGKTTTLYAALNEVNTPEYNITTIEDPVEYVFPMINQIQINEPAGVDFAAGLRTILRQDPDMILVGEIRDEETARIAVQAALTGHFVLSSVHATDAVSSVSRFIDMGIEPFLLASSVLGVIGQRLLRQICKHCKEEYTPSKEELDFFLEAGGSPSKHKFYLGSGCNYCAHTGYIGRTGVYELLMISDNMRTMLSDRHATQHDLKSLAIKEGMHPLRLEGARKVEEDMTTIFEVIRSIRML